MVPRIRLVIVCHRTKLSEYCWLYLLCCALHPCNLFYNWRCAPFKPLHLSAHPWRSPLSSNHQCVSCFCGPASVLFCWFYFFSAVCVKSYHVCLSLFDLLHLALYPPGPLQMARFLLLSTAEWYSVVCRCHTFTYSSIKGHSGCFHISAAIIVAAEHRDASSLWISVLVFFG